jgi:hypothetical protein
MEPPLEAVPPTIAAVTMAVTLGAGSVREVMAALGTNSFRQVFDALRDARQLGLVAFEDGRQRTMRPTLGIVAASPR